MTYPLKVKVTQYRANRSVVSNWINLSNGHFRGRIQGWVTREWYSFKGRLISRAMKGLIILLRLFFYSYTSWLNDIPPNQKVTKCI